MKEELSSFRREMDSIKAVGLYSITNKVCLYSDENVGTWPFALELCKENLSSNTEFVHFETNGNRFLGHYNEDHLLIIQLEETKEINIVILELKTRHLLTSLIK